MSNMGFESLSNQQHIGNRKYTHTHIYTHIYIYIYTHIYIYIYTHTYTHIYIHTHIYAYIYIYIYVYVYIYIYIYIYLHIYVYIYIYISNIDIWDGHEHMGKGQHLSFSPIQRFYFEGALILSHVNIRKSSFLIYVTWQPQPKSGFLYICEWLSPRIMGNSSLFFSRKGDDELNPLDYDDHFSVELGNKPLLIATRGW